MSRRANNARRAAELAANPPPPAPPPIDKDDLIARLSYDLTRANERIEDLKRQLLLKKPRAPTQAEIDEAVRRSMSLYIAGSGGEAEKVHPRENKKRDN